MIKKIIVALCLVSSIFISMALPVNAAQPVYVYSTPYNYPVLLDQSYLNQATWNVMYPTIPYNPYYYDPYHYNPYYINPYYAVPVAYYGTYCPLQYYSCPCH